MINNDTLAIAFGLGSAVAWGAGDFSGGYASRRGNLLSVILLSQLLGGMLLTAMALLFSETIPPFRHLFYGVLAGVFGNLGLIALYKGLVQGRMGIVAPLSAVLTALVPIGYSIFYEGLPAMTQALGFFCFMIAVWLLSSGDTGIRMSLKEFLLSFAAGLGFGFFFIFIDRANDLTVFWPLVGARFASVSFLFLIMLTRGKSLKPKSGQWMGVAAAFVALILIAV